MAHKVQVMQSKSGFSFLDFLRLSGGHIKLQQIMGKQYQENSIIVSKICFSNGMYGIDMFFI